MTLDPSNASAAFSADFSLDFGPDANRGVVGALTEPEFPDADFSFFLTGVFPVWEFDEFLPSISSTRVFSVRFSSSGVFDVDLIFIAVSR